MNKTFLRIFVRNLEVLARIGVHGHEQGIPQPVRVNVTLDVSTTPADDKLDGTVNYETITSAIRAIVAAGHINLAETLAERIAHACMENALVTRAVVKVEKLHALEGAEAAGVEIEKTR